MEPPSVPLPPKDPGAPGLSQREFKASHVSPVKLEHLLTLPLHLVLPACRCPYREGLDSFPFLWRLDLVGKKSGGKWRTGRSEGKRKARRLLTKSLVPAFLSGNPELKSMLQVEDADTGLRYLKIQREPSISGPGHPTYPHLEGLHTYSALRTIPLDFARWETITRPVPWRSLWKGQKHLPLELLIELLTERIDTIPVQVLVQGVCGFVCRQEEETVRKKTQQAPTLWRDIIDPIPSLPTPPGAGAGDGVVREMDTLVFTRPFPEQPCA